MKESLIQSKIITRHKKAGWFVTKIIQSTTNGIPDLLLIKEGKAFFIEVKSEGGKLSPLQSYVHDLIRNQAVVVFVTCSPLFNLDAHLETQKIYRALGHEPMWLHRDKIKAAEKIIKSTKKKK